MALKLIYGGGATAGAANGTLVSSGNPIVFTALDTPVACFIRADDDTYSPDASFSPPSDGQVQVSFAGTGGPWYAFATNPNAYGADIGDLNVAIHLRQHASAAASTGFLTTDYSTNPAATAAPNVSSLTVTPGNAQNVLTWSDVANDSGYLIETSANGTSGWSTVITTAAGATSYTHSGLTNGTPYYYRITTVGTGRYKNATTFATGNGTPVALTVKAAVLALSPLVYYEFAETSGTAIADQGSLNVAATAVGSPTLNQTGPKGSDKAILFTPGAYIHANAVSNGLDFNGTASFTVALWFKPTSAADTSLINYMLSSPSWYGWDYEWLGTGKIYRFRGRGVLTPNYYDNQYNQALTAGTWYHLAFVCNGTDVKFYLNGTLADTWTPASMTMQAPSSANSTGRLHIGTNDTHSSPANGAIAHPCVFNSALSQAQVATMYNGA